LSLLSLIISLQLLPGKRYTKYMANDGGDGLVVFLERNRLFLAHGEKVYYTDFPTTVVRDLDIIDREALRGLITSLIDKNNITPSGFYLILSQWVCFIENLEEKEETKQEKEFKNFCDNVPFTSVSARKYLTKEGFIAIAANKELIDEITMDFEEKGFKLFAVAPSLMMGAVGAKKQPDAEMVKFINTNSVYVREQSFEQKEAVPEEVHEVGKRGKFKVKKIYLLGAVFVVLIVIMVAMVLLR
jgi:hypothetical protein